MAALRVDLVFSYWVYFWYILYSFNITYYSPKFPLVLGLADNIVMLYLMILYGTRYTTIIYFIIINTIIKVIPLCYLWHQPIRAKDIYFTLGLFIVFVLWLHINEQSLIGNLKLVHDSLLYGESKTPFLHFMNKLQVNFKYLAF
jgi:hypothetical protein